MLTKEYKYVVPPAVADDKPDENGITEAMIDFSWERDVTISVRCVELISLEWCIISLAELIYLSLLEREN